MGCLRCDGCDNVISIIDPPIGEIQYYCQGCGDYKRKDEIHESEDTLYHD